MKYLGYIALFNIFLFASYAPNWYHSISNKTNFYIGYGSGSSELEAKANARNDISSSISVSINITFSKQATNEKEVFTKTIKQSSFQKSKSIIGDTKVLKLESHDGIYFLDITRTLLILNIRS